MNAIEHEVIDSYLDSLLSQWHSWQRSDTSKGYNTRALVCGDYRTSRQYDDTNGALDAGLEHMTMKAVDFQVIQMADPHKAAIYANARSIATGSAVWSSPRLPSDKEALAAVVSEARSMLKRRLQSVGVM